MTRDEAVEWINDPTISRQERMRRKNQVFFILYSSPCPTLKQFIETGAVSKGERND